MDKELIIRIAMLAAMLLLGFAANYLKTRKDITGAVAGKIDEAEKLYADCTKAGGQKFEWVVDTLYGYVPVWLRPILSREVIAQLVQSTFDVIQGYAYKQAEKWFPPADKEQK